MHKIFFSSFDSQLAAKAADRQVITVDNSESLLIEVTV